MKYPNVTTEDMYANTTKTVMVTLPHNGYYCSKISGFFLLMVVLTVVFDCLASISCV